MENIFKVSLYIRVSTEKQLEGDSLEEQESELRKFCEYKKFLIHKIHIERGQSAKDTKRTEYQLLVQDIKDKKINAVVVKKLDRLSRSLLDFEEFMRIAQEFNVEFISLRENFDTTNAIGKAMLRVALVFAQLEREQTAERISDVMTYRASQGLFNGGIVAYGYDVINKELIPHKQEKKVIQLMFDKYIETKSTTVVEKTLTGMGIRNRQGLLWDRRTIQKILCNPVYLGTIKWKNNTYKGVHQPLVSELAFNTVQNILNERKYKKDKSVIGGTFRGLLYCGYCNNPLSPTYTKKKNGKKYYFYRCISTMNPGTKKKYQCKSHYYNLEALDKTLIDKILEYSSEKKLAFLKSQTDQYNSKIESELSALKDELTGFQKQLSDISTKKEKYLDSLINNDFNSAERKLINEKIEEFSLQEKQLKASIYRQEFDIAEKSESIQSIEGFKEQIIYFKVNHSAMTSSELIDWLRKNIETIIHTDEETKIEFKLLKMVR